MICLGHTLELAKLLHEIANLFSIYLKVFW
jgi:hypothetical protein